MGTPSAILVDSEGRIASKLAVGAESVLELAGTPNEAQLTLPSGRQLAVEPIA
jgi:hypothetical protein